MPRPLDHGTAGGHPRRLGEGGPDRGVDAAVGAGGDGVGIVAIDALHVSVSPGGRLDRIVIAEVEAGGVGAELVQLGPDVGACHLTVVAAQAVVLLVFEYEQPLVPAGGVGPVAASAGVLGHGGVGPVAGLGPADRGIGQAVGAGRPAVHHVAGRAQGAVFVGHDHEVAVTVVVRIVAGGALELPAGVQPDL